MGLRIGFNYVTWSQLESTGSHCNILKWDCQSVSDLPLNASPAEVIKMVNTLGQYHKSEWVQSSMSHEYLIYSELLQGVGIAKDIPIADAYVMEKDGSRPLSQINTSIYRLLLRHQQLIAIVLTTLSTKYRSEQSPGTFISHLYLWSFSQYDE